MRRIGVGDGPDSVEDPQCGEGQRASRRLCCLPERAAAVERSQHVLHGFVAGEPCRRPCKALGGAREAFHVERQIAEHPFSTPMCSEARLDERQGVEAERLGVGSRGSRRVENEFSVRPAEALEQPDAQLVFERDEEFLRSQ